MLLGRRFLLTALPGLGMMAAGRRALAAAPAAPQVPSGGALNFAVFRNGSRIGAHSVHFAQEGEGLRVTTHAHFSVGLGPIKLFNYLYDVTETWQGGMLHEIAAHTNDDGSPQSCHAMREEGGGGLQVQGSKSGRYTAPAASIAGTHWNEDEIKAPMINPENGVLMKFDVRQAGSSAPPGGGPAATHYALTGFATLDLWYADRRWVGLKAVAKDKSIIEYHAA